MTLLYRPVEITSAEQAEALPIGTVAVFPGEPSAAVRVDYGLGWRIADDESSDDHGFMTGWVALVPIEAKEEWTAMGTDGGEPWVAYVGPEGIDGTRAEAEQYISRHGGFLAHRDLTPWQEADQ